MRIISGHYVNNNFRNIIFYTHTHTHTLVTACIIIYIFNVERDTYKNNQLVCNKYRREFHETSLD